MFKNFKYLPALLCAVSAITSAVADTPVRSCAGGLARPLAVQVDSCTESPCELWRGFSTNMTIQFVSTRNAVKNIRADIVMSSLGIGMPFAINPERTDVCKNLMFEAYCPMDRDEDATYNLILDVAKHQPEVPAKIEVAIKDTSDNAVLACFILDARITKRNGPLKQ